MDRGEVFRFTAPRIPVAGSHGTGCTLSAAITAALAQGESLPWAVELAKNYLGETLLQSYEFQSPAAEPSTRSTKAPSPEKNEA